MKLTSQDYWENHWKGYTELDDQGGGCELYDDIAPFLPRGDNLSFFEIGCAPGRILADFCGRLGYTAYGLDYACDPVAIEDFLRKRGIRVGKVEKGDFFSWKPEERFNMVGSFGFIEHFDDAAGVVDRHFEMVKPGGHVILGMPNFAGGQKALHWLFDRKNLNGHNTRIMNVPFLEDAARRNGAQIVQARYTGGHFDFWLDDEAPLLARRVVWKVVPPLQALTNRVLPGDTNPWFSPYLLAIYKAPGGPSTPQA